MHTIVPISKSNGWSDTKQCSDWQENILLQALFPHGCRSHHHDHTINSWFHERWITIMHDFCSLESSEMLAIERFTTIIFVSSKESRECCPEVCSRHDTIGIEWCDTYPHEAELTGSLAISSHLSRLLCHIIKSTLHRRIRHLPHDCHSIDW